MGIAFKGIRNDAIEEMRQDDPEGAAKLDSAYAREDAGPFDVVVLTGHEECETTIATLRAKLAEANVVVAGRRADSLLLGERAKAFEEALQVQEQWLEEIMKSAISPTDQLVQRALDALREARKK